MNDTTNAVEVIGQLQNGLYLSHEKMGEKFYAGTLKVKRLSGAEDLLPVTIPGRLYEQARKDVRNYLRAVKRMREKAGLPEMKYIYVIEEEGADGEKRRIHVHLMMTGGISREALEEKWGRGYANCDRLQPEEGNGLMELARYFTKLEQEKHRRAWSASKNLRELMGDDFRQEFPWEDE